MAQHLMGIMSMNTRYLSPFALLAGSLLALGCQTEQPPEEEPTTRIDLRQQLDRGSVSVIGVGIAPDTGARIVFDEQSGIYEIAADGTTSKLLDMAAMPDPEVEIRLPFTDMVAMGGGEFAVTAIGDGFLLNLGENTLKQHFCYVPDALPVELDQKTEAVTYDAERQLLIAQPQTFDTLDGAIWGSQIARYDRVTGTDLEWYDLPDREFLAGGMVMDSDGTLLLGANAILHRFDFDSRQLVEVDDLGRFGVKRIDGLAMDHDAGRLVVVDNKRDELIEIELTQLGQ